MKISDSRGSRVSVASYIASIIVLAIIAASGFVLYFSSAGTTSTVTLTSISSTTVTSTISVSGSETAATSYSTSTQTVSNTALVFNGTLVIIPAGVAVNQSLNFIPSTLKVIVGVNNTITWLNQDSLSQHTVVTTSVPNGAQSFAAVIKTGQTYTTTLTVPGTYRYFCMWHPDWMKGTIVVIG